MECWYRFSATGSKPLYGFGTLAQAFRFANRLNRTPTERAYSTSAVRNEEVQELRLENDVEALSITLALAQKG